MRFALILSLCALAIFCAVPGSVSAAPVTWTLQGVTFNDGGTASGSFVYDAQTNTYSAINITTTTGTTRTGASYAFVCITPCTQAQPSPVVVLFLTASSASDQTGLPVLGIAFLPPGLTDPPAKDVPFFSEEAQCANPTCDDFDPPLRFPVAGRIISVEPGPIPTLSEWGTILLVLSLLAMGMWQLAGRPAWSRPWSRRT
jgi:hypothetical protein